MVVQQKYLMPFEEQDSEDWIRGIIYEYHTYALHESIVYKMAKINRTNWRKEKDVYFPDTTFAKIIYLEDLSLDTFDKISNDLQEVHPPSDIRVNYQ